MAGRAHNTRVQDEVQGVGTPHAQALQHAHIQHLRRAMRQVYAVIDALKPLSVSPITMHDALWTVRSLLWWGEVQWPLAYRSCVPARPLPIPRERGLGGSVSRMI